MSASSKNLFVTIPLIFLMALTRINHFGTALSLPDASLAVFFLAGLGLTTPWLFALLILEAGLIDYLAVNHYGVSDYCLSPAYLSLIPTYAIMWLAGRYAKTFLALNFADSLKTFGLAASSVTVAFGISNSSFYWFSGKFGDMSWLTYLSRTVHYFWPYLSSTLIYSMVGLAVIKIWQAVYKVELVKGEG